MTNTARTTTITPVAARIQRMRQVMGAEAIPLLVVTPGSDLAYLIGHFGHPSERPVFLLIPLKGEPVVVIAEFESRGLPDLRGQVQVATYGETQDVYALVQENVDTNQSPIAISDQAWSRFLLGLQETLPDSRFVYASQFIRRLRMIKDQSEIDRLRRAATIADSVFPRILDEPLSGSTEKAISERIKRDLERAGLDRTGAIVASGPNGASPHHRSGERTVRKGDLVVMDFGGTLEGYWADITRTVSVGQPGEVERAAYAAVLAGHDRAIEAVRPGVPAGSIDAAARRVIEDAGFGEHFIHRTGHGIGLDGHEEPYMVAGNTIQLQPGMTFSVEPGVYISGRFGIRIEDIVAVMESGADVLNRAPRELMTVR